MAVKNRRTGFTIVEFLITAILISVLCLVLPRVFHQLSLSIMTASSKMQSESEAQVAVRELAQFLSSARRSTITISQNTGEPSYSRIDYTDVSNEAVSIYQSTGSLVMDKAGQQAVLLKTNLYRLNFGYPDLSDDKDLSATVMIKDTSPIGTPMGHATQMISLENQ